MAEVSSGTDQYRVAVFSAPDDPQALSRVFQSQLDLHPTDALIWANHLPGVLNHTFPVEQARALVVALLDIGIHSSVIAPGDLPEPQRALVVHHVRCTEQGLEIVQRYGETDLLVPWAAVELICIGEVPVETRRHFSAGTWTGISAGHHYQSPSSSLPGPPSLEVWIVCQPPLPMLCIDHGHMNYEYLGARRVDSATFNFREFITDLTRHATRATLTESTRAYLSHVDPEQYRYRSLEALLHAVTLQTLIARAVPVRPDIVPPSPSDVPS
jgi:hypothetical protein